MIKSILLLLLVIFIITYIISFFCGIVQFFIDLRKYKTSIKFSGKRKALIEHLMNAKKEKKEVQNDF